MQYLKTITSNTKNVNLSKTYFKSLNQTLNRDFPNILDFILKIQTPRMRTKVVAKFAWTPCYAICFITQK